MTPTELNEKIKHAKYHGTCWAEVEFDESKDSACANDFQIAKVDEQPDIDDLLDDCTDGQKEMLRAIVVEMARAEYERLCAEMEPAGPDPDREPDGFDDWRDKL